MLSLTIQILLKTNNIALFKKEYEENQLLLQTEPATASKASSHLHLYLSSPILTLPLAIIVEEESEVDPNEELDDLDRRSATRSFFEDLPRKAAAAPSLSEYNRRATEEGTSTEYSDPARLSPSFLLDCGADKKYVETEPCGGLSEDRTVESISENVEHEEDAEGIHKPEALVVSPSAQKSEENKNAGENVVPTPQARLPKHINLSVIPSNEEKVGKIKAMKRVEEAIAARESLKDAKKVVNLVVKDFREGYLEKRSKSMMTLWKQRYCRVGNAQFSCYKDLSAGWLSDFVDFKKVAVKVEMDRASCCFLYDFAWIMDLSVVCHCGRATTGRLSSFAVPIRKNWTDGCRRSI